jgi:transposase
MLRPTPPIATRPWSPLADPEWVALAPLLPRSRIRDLRHRLNCILAVAAHAAPWVPAAAQGPFWPTLYRHYHRWARAGVWARLHRAAGEAAAPPALRALAAWAAALHRRAARIAPPLQALNSSNPKPAARQTRLAPGPAPVAPPAASISLSRFQALTATNPKPPTRGVQRPFGLWRGGAEGQRPFALPLLDTHPARRQFAATGQGKRAA